MLHATTGGGEPLRERSVSFNDSHNKTAEKLRTMAVTPSGTMSQDRQRSGSSEPNTSNQTSPEKGHDKGTHVGGKYYRANSFASSAGLGDSVAAWNASAASIAVSGYLASGADLTSSPSRHPSDSNSSGQTAMVQPPTLSLLEHLEDGSPAATRYQALKKRLAEEQENAQQPTAAAVGRHPRFSLGSVDGSMRPSIAVDQPLFTVITDDPEPTPTSRLNSSLLGAHNTPHRLSLTRTPKNRNSMSLTSTTQYAHSGSISKLHASSTPGGRSSHQGDLVPLMMGGETNNTSLLPPPSLKTPTPSAAMGKRSQLAAAGASFNNSLLTPTTHARKPSNSTSGGKPTPPSAAMMVLPSHGASSSPSMSVTTPPQRRLTSPGVITSPYTPTGASFTPEANEQRSQHHHHSTPQEQLRSAARSSLLVNATINMDVLGGRKPSLSPMASRSTSVALARHQQQQHTSHVAGTKRAPHGSLVSVTEKAHQQFIMSLSPTDIVHAGCHKILSAALPPCEYISTTGTGPGTHDSHGLLGNALQHATTTRETREHSFALHALLEKEDEARDRLARRFTEQQRRFFITLLDEYNTAVKPFAEIVLSLRRNPNCKEVLSRRVKAEVAVLQVISMHSTTLTETIP